MFEELLEDIAQKNGLREVNTYLKLDRGSRSYPPLPAFNELHSSSLYCSSPHGSDSHPCAGGCENLC